MTKSLLSVSMNAKEYKVTCKNCKQSARMSITQQNQVIYKEHLPIVSSRFRGDLKWGFQCICGNDSRLCVEEKDQLNILVRASSSTIVEQITKRLKKNNEKQFVMEVI